MEASSITVQVAQLAPGITHIGLSDHDIDLFEGQYMLERGMAYNSYVVEGETAVAVMDSVDAAAGEQWMAALAELLDGRAPDYLVVQHMEPDHSANIGRFMEAYPAAKVVASAKAFTFMKNFYGTDYPERQIVIKEGDSLDLGGHVLQFVAAPMVHWPEVMMTFDASTGTFFSADAFGKFGALDIEDPEGWACEARRYYFGIVGKFGKQAQALLAKAAGLDIQRICPLHGPVLEEDLGYYLDLYNTWTTYGVETPGVAICYCSVYGHTEEAALLLARKLEEAGCPKVAVSDLTRDDMAEAVEDAFRYGTLVLAAPTLANDLFPTMKTFIDHLVDHAYQNRRVAFMENGSWAPQAGKVMRAKMEACKDITFAETQVSLVSALNDESRAQVEALAAELMA